MQKKAKGFASKLQLQHLEKRAKPVHGDCDMTEKATSLDEFTNITKKKNPIFVGVAVCLIFSKYFWRKIEYLRDFDGKKSLLPPPKKKKKMIINK